MGGDSLVTQDKGTEVSSLSRDKGTTGQAQNLAMGWAGRDGILTFCHGMGRDGILTFCHGTDLDGTEL